MIMLFLSGCVGNEKTNIQNNSQSNQINAGIPTPVPTTIILEPVREEVEVYMTEVNPRKIQVFGVILPQATNLTLLQNKLKLS